MKQLTNYFFIDFVKSTSIVLFTSSLIGLSFTLWDKPFWSPFILSVCLQYILFSVIATVFTQYFQSKVRIAELDKLEPLSTILECAVCKGQNVTTFIPDQNERFEFVCDRCNNKNVVNINFTVAKVTEFTDPMQVAASPLLNIPKI